MSIVLIVLLFLINALFMPLIVELVKERAPGLALRLIKFSVRLLPAAYRDRYFAEWTAELEEMNRQNISQLVASIRILLGAPSVARVLRAKDRHRTLAEGLAYLTTSERRVIRARRHWVCLLRVICETEGIVIAWSLLSQLISRRAGDAAWAAIVQSLLWCLVALAILRLAYKVLKWWLELIIVTEKRFMLLTGVVVRKISMMPITKVTDLSLLQTVGGWMMGYGTLRVESAGQKHDLEEIDYLPVPEAIFDTISELIFGEKGQKRSNMLSPPCLRCLWHRLLARIRPR
jgi:membrane protein YdbS with pleckstrin-like domain